MDVKQAQQYIAEGYRFVVDLDLEKFFDLRKRGVASDLAARGGWRTVRPSLSRCPTPTLPRLGFSL